MPEFVTRAELRSFAAKKTSTEQQVIRKNASSRSLNGSTFLSHSSKDEDLVVGATIVLENHGALVYTDEKDPEMPPYTTAETAALLKTRIRQTKRFVLLTSKKSKDSKWVPWELGVADGSKGMSPIALFPSADSPTDMSWASSEYLGLYQRIVWGKIRGREKEEWIVWDERPNTAVTLRHWLTSS
ncbi:toll/interleukin-1 receptor domain-containing protein [Agrobacterium leguminum]|uniref:toll/interleukin-1 receptor domain-containing protein n=1 Tax=Agrobacterium TaxID=357 RepID=UPI0009BC0A7D|nr:MULTISPECIES: toll/interleukin-1 receptor domain-containing protein [Agrobacterium]WFS69323.1 toll/interleukin-1 receptor domain-containing protein [Agrobacterium leguminum]